MHLGTTISTLRRLAGLNQTELARRCTYTYPNGYRSYSFSHISLVEAGKRKVTTKFLTALESGLRLQPGDVTFAHEYISGTVHDTNRWDAIRNKLTAQISDLAGVPRVARS